MSGQDSTGEPDLARRSVVRGVALGGLALPLLAACGGGAGQGASSAPSTTPRKHHRKSGSGSGGGPALAQTSDVPVGSGTILSGQQVVLTQPSKGQFKAFSSICTHQGCPVSQITNGSIVCPCHGSEFSIKDGSVIAGPAPAPLPPVNIAVQGNKITRA